MPLSLVLKDILLWFLVFRFIYMLVFWSACLYCLPVCQSDLNGWFRSQGKYRATLGFKSSGCAESQGISQALYDDVVCHFPNPLVLKTILYWKNSGLFYGYLRKFFFFKKMLFMILHTCMWYLISFSILSHSVPIFHFLYLSLLYYLNIWKNLIFILPYYFYLFHVYCFI